MSKKKENSDDEITLADTVIGQVLEGESIKSSVPEPVEAVAKGSLLDKGDKMSTSQLIAEQHKDTELASLFARVVDVDAVERNFKPGQKVLALLPVPGNPLNSRFFGPSVIQKKLIDLNYVVVTPERRKQTQLCHVNMLKPYVERSSTPVLQPVNVNVVVSEPKEDLSSELSIDSFGPTDTTRLMNTDVLRNLDSKLSHLSESQHQDLEKLLLEFKHLFPDVPTRTDQIYHDVDVENADPVKQHPYRLNPSKQKYLKEEIQYLLEKDFIEPSNSSWSSPCILVPKPDGSYRMCTNYRKVNSVTKTNTFPIP